MVTRHKRGKITWVDLESPTREELSQIMREFSIDSRVEDEIASTTPYPLVISSTKYVYMVLHFPTTDPSGGTKNQEVDFIVGKNFLITARYEIIKTIHNLHKVFEAEELLGLHGSIYTAETLLERVLRRMYTAIREEMETISESLDRIEHDIFTGKEKQTVRIISETNRILLRFDTTLKQHAESLPTFLSELSGSTFFGKKFEQHAIHIEAEHDHIASLVSSYRDVAAELRDTNDSLLSASQNEVMKTLTVITFTILPLSLIASLFQMNVNTPLRDDPNSFWAILAGMLIISGVLTLLAKRKKWL
jgi:magnesium transporter